METTAKVEHSALSAIGPRVLEERERLAREFQSAEPFRHVVIGDFFREDLCRKLTEEFPRFEDRYALNESGEVGGKAVRTDVRDISDAYREADRCFQSSEFLELISEITGIPKLLYDPEYVGGGTHENLEGQWLDPHVDFNYHPTTRRHRRLNLIVYLNPGWNESWGGNIEFHSNPWDPEANRIKTVLPVLNQAVIFETSEVSWHGFSQIRLPADHKELSRKSLAIYLYTEERPPEETAADHATVYVPDSMPADIEAGKTLTAEQMSELRRRFTAMRGMLKFLYDREKRFTDHIEKLKGPREAGSSRAPPQRIDLQGYAVQPGGATGLWPDDWAGRRFRAVFVPTRPARALELEVLVAEELEEDQVLRFTAGDAKAKETLSPGATAKVRLPISAPAGEPVELSIRGKHASAAPNTSDPDAVRRVAFKLISAVLEH